MTARDAGERHARMVLSFLARPGDPVIGVLLRSRTPAEVLAAVTGTCEPRIGGLQTLPGVPGLAAALRTWRQRLGLTPPAARLAAWQAEGLRLICPGDDEWPPRLDDLGDTRPLLLWVRGSTSLRDACARSVAVTGSRAATACGQHMSLQISAGLAGQGMTVISGGAAGVDCKAHAGALAADGLTVAVLGGGLSSRCPRETAMMLAAIGAQGMLVSECPPWHAPDRASLLARHRVTAALACGLVVVEAALRSGTLATARHARDLGRQVMAVPGPFTSVQSAGCHELIREHGAACVRSEHDVIACIERAGAA
jgi:DNA processing protein